MRAGLRAIGSSRWLVATVAMGRMATKSLMRQSRGTKGATARMTIAVMKKRENAIEYLNCKEIVCQYSSSNDSGLSELDLHSSEPWELR